jgi:hypothetical protein
VSQSAATSTVTVNQNPTVTVNSGTICQGQSFTITPSGANSYTYQGGSSVVSPSTQSTYSVTGLSNAGCVAINTVISTVFVAANPIISVNSGSICLGESFTLNPNGAATYTYSSGSNVVNPASTSVYSVSGTSSTGCVSQASATGTVIVFPVPNINISGYSDLCIGEKTTIKANGAISYTWNTGITTASMSINPSITTVYTVTGVNANACVNTQTIEVTVSPCTGLGENVMNGLAMYPNPSGGMITLKVPEPMQFVLINELGQVIREMTVEQSETIDLTDVAKGVYYIISKDLRYKQRLILTE